MLLLNMRVRKVPVSGLSFLDRETGEDKTETARSIMREKAPELLELMAQVSMYMYLYIYIYMCAVENYIRVYSSSSREVVLGALSGFFFFFF